MCVCYVICGAWPEAASREICQKQEVICQGVLQTVSAHEPSRMERKEWPSRSRQPEVLVWAKSSKHASLALWICVLVLTYSTKKSRRRLCLISLARLALQATRLPMASSGALHGCFAPGSCLPHRWPAPGDASPNLCCNPHLKGPFATLVNGAVGSV